jgi:flagellar basal body-associated protein FliL
LRPYLDGQPDRMEGGVAIILLLVVAVAVVFIVAMYLTGGALLSRADKNDQPPREKSDPVDRSDVYTQHNELR